MSYANQLPEDMMGGQIIATQSMGIQGLQDDGFSKRVALTHDYARSGLEPVSIASDSAGISPNITQAGVAALKLVAGTDMHPDVAALNLPSITGGNTPSSHVEAQATPVAPRNGHEGRGIG